MDKVTDRGLVELGRLLVVVVAVGRFRPGLCRAGDAGEFVQHPVHIRGGVPVGVGADQQYPCFIAGERDNDPIVAAQVLHAQVRKRIVSGEPVAERGASVQGEHVLELVVRLAPGPRRPAICRSATRVDLTV